MEASSDGVFSTAATLLVLDIAIHPPGTPLERLRPLTQRLGMRVLQ
jgi:hypothetical protein